MNPNTNNKLTPYVSNKSVQQGLSYLEDKVPTLFLVIQGIVLGLAKIIMSIRAFFYKITGGIFANIQIPWFKVFMISLAVYILTQKDIMINFNLNSPESPTSTISTTEALNVASVTPPPPPTVSLDDIDESIVRAYIRRFERVAKVEMEKFNIPASIKMAQGILESKAGQQQLSTQLNNHFSIRCAAIETNHTCIETNMGSFKKYSSAWEGWRAHSVLLSEEKFQSIFKSKNYKEWANQLQKLGYSSDAQYGQKLILIIEKYNLSRLDK